MSGVLKVAIPALDLRPDDLPLKPLMQPQAVGNERQFTHTVHFHSRSYYHVIILIISVVKTLEKTRHILEDGNTYNDSNRCLLIWQGERGGGG